MKIISKNKKAFLDYDISETFETGIILKWHEVKSIKSWKVNIKDAIIKISWWEIFIINMDIQLYPMTAPQTVKSYQPKWERKLLLTKRQIIKLSERTNKTGLMLLPLQIYINKDRLIKLEIWLAKIRKKIDKKQIIKERDIYKEAKRDIKRLKIW